MHQYKDIDLYSILGINQTASKKDIKAAYRNLARKYHPDVNKGNKLSEKKFKEVGEAYEILVDDLKKKQYDLIRGIVRARTSTSEVKKAYSKQSDTASNTKQAPKKDEKEEKKVSEDKPFSDAFSDFLDGVFKKSGEQQNSKPKFEQKEKTIKKEKPKPINGSDITVDLTITVNEAQNGTVRRVNVLHTEQCKNCNGKKFINSSKCRICSGKGELSTHKKLNVKIPGSVKEGSKVRIPEEGNQGLFGGKHGDLYLKIHIERCELFRYDGLNVLSDIPLTPWEAALGTNIQVPTIDGNVSMKIPPETTSTQKFKLSGQGIVDKDGKTKGDHIVTVYVEIPKNLTQAEKELYQGLAKQREFNPRADLYEVEKK